MGALELIRGQVLQCSHRIRSTRLSPDIKQQSTVVIPGHRRRTGPGISRVSVELSRSGSSFHLARHQAEFESFAVSVNSDSTSGSRQASRAIASGAQNTTQRPVVILPGLGNNSADYVQLVDHLQLQGLQAVVAKVSRPDWLRNAAGLADSNYWKGTLRPRPVVDWYLKRVQAAINAALAATPGSDKVSLVAHSAGGWLARVFLAEFGHDNVALLLTLGTPHQPPPRGVPGVIDQTRGLLYHIEDHFPGTFHAPHVKYVCVAGRYMKGKRMFRREPQVVPTGVGTVPSQTGLVGAAVSAMAAADAGIAESGDGQQGSIEVSSGLAEPAEPTLQARIIGQGYKMVCGEVEVWGDGVVPEASAFLEGANNVSIPGVYHSPVGATDEGRPWYGSPAVLDKWVYHLHQ